MDATGAWSYINLYYIRTSEGTAYFIFRDSTDRLSLIAQGDSQGTGRIVVAVPAVYPAQLTDLGFVEK
jgi:hypothetical protein